MYNFTVNNTIDRDVTKLVIQEDGVIACTECEYATLSMEVAKAHFKVRHGQTSPSNIFSCKMCPEVFSTRNQVLNHLKETHFADALPSRKDRSFECEQCSYKSDLPRNFERHVNTVHLGKKDFICDSCLISIKILFSSFKSEHCPCDIFFSNS